MSEMNLKSSPQIRSVIQEIFLTMSLSSFKIGNFRYQACLANELSGRGDKKKEKKEFLVLIYSAPLRISLSFSLDFVLRFFIVKGLIVVHKILIILSQEAHHSVKALPHCDC